MCLKYRPKGLQFYQQQLVVSFHLLDALVTMSSVGVTAWQHTFIMHCFHFNYIVVFRDIMQIQVICILS